MEHENDSLAGLVDRVSGGAWEAADQQGSMGTAGGVDAQDEGGRGVFVVEC